MMHKDSSAKSEGSAGDRGRGTAISMNQLPGPSGSTGVSRGSEENWFTRHTALALLADTMGVFLFLGGVSSQDVVTGVLGIALMALGVLFISMQGSAPRRCSACPPQ